MENKEQRLRVVMLPWLAHGHISPFLELAKKLTQRNFHIYLCSTPISLSPIRQKHGDNPFPFIEFVDYNLPSTPDLPPHYHTTKSLPPHLMSALRRAFDDSKPTLSNLLKLLNPDLLIYDLMQTWGHTIASTHNIPAVGFLTSGATPFSFFMHMAIKQGVEFPYPAIYLSQQEFFKIIKSIGTEDRSVGGVDSSFKMILIKSFPEIEAKYMGYVSSLLGTEMLPIGPLIQEPVTVDDDADGKPSKFIEWLNNKDRSSAVFVSFGSEYYLSKEEIQEIAYGLELSKVSFIWVIRFPTGEKTSVDEVLPEGFLNRVGDRGMVVEGWAPQEEILKHCSIGGFVSHCGWSSVMEGMNYGVPFIAIPMQIDQPLIARLLVEVGIAMEVKRENIGGEEKIVRGEVAKVLNEVVIEKEGEKVRNRAKELSETMSKKGDAEIDVAVEKLLHLCGKSEKKEK